MRTTNPNADKVPLPRRGDKILDEYRSHVASRRPKDFLSHSIADLMDFMKFQHEGLQHRGSPIQKFRATTNKDQKAAERGFNAMMDLASGDLIVRTVKIGRTRFECSDTEFQTVKEIFRKKYVVTNYAFSKRADDVAACISIFLGAFDLSSFSKRTLLCAFPDFTMTANRFRNEDQFRDELLKEQERRRTFRVKTPSKPALPPWIDHRSDEAQAYEIPQEIPSLWIKAHDEYQARLSSAATPG